MATITLTVYTASVAQEQTMTSINASDSTSEQTNKIDNNKQVLHEWALGLLNYPTNASDSVKEEVKKDVEEIISLIDVDTWFKRVRPTSGSMVAPGGGVVR